MKCKRAHFRAPVDFPIGGHVNGLSDYQETGLENLFLFF